MTQVVISIGSNIDRELNVKRAVSNLAHTFGSLSCSPVYESEASGFDGPPFYNLVVVFETSMDVSSVRQKIRAIEICQGRQIGNDRRGSRSLDLDLLLYGNFVLYDIDIDVPRQEIFHHAYILKPLAELLPEVCHPLTGESFRDIWSRFSLQPESLVLVEELQLS